jgi:hypothetical protein
MRSMASTRALTTLEVVAAASGRAKKAATSAANKAVTRRLDRVCIVPSLDPDFAVARRFKDSVLVIVMVNKAFTQEAAM